jgi:glyoxylate utilization-related uncharacterized protein
LEMPKTSKESASQVQSVEGMLEDRSEDLDGYTAGFTSFMGDMDPAPLFQGLPDDRCQCPHWGYVIKGKITYRFADREETYEAGDAYYVPPGHLPLVYEGNEVVEFSPTDELAKTMEVLNRNMAASEQA